MSLTEEYDLLHKCPFIERTSLGRIIKFVFKRKYDGYSLRFVFGHHSYTEGIVRRKLWELLDESESLGGYITRDDALDIISELLRQYPEEFLEFPIYSHIFFGESDVRD